MQENATPSEGVQIKHVQHNEKSQWPFSDDLFLRGRYNVHVLPQVYRIRHFWFTAEKCPVLLG